MITVLILIVVLGVCLYLVETYVPMSPPIQTILRVVVVLFVVLLLLSMFGIVDIPLRSLR